MATGQTEYYPGDLVEIMRVGSYTLWCRGEPHNLVLREYPAEEYKVRSHPKPRHYNLLTTFEGKVGLLLERVLNSLGQPIAYKVLIDGKKMHCQAKTAHKFFKRTVSSDTGDGLVHEKKNIEK